jgi:hypothetical protein
MCSAQFFEEMNEEMNMSKQTKITPNLDFPNDESTYVIAENVGRAVQKSGAPNDVKRPSTIDELENEDLEVDEGLESGIPERPGNVPRF